MGDIKKPKKKYLTPAHPWILAEIEEGKQLKKEYGLRQRKEILIAKSFLKKYKDRAKHLIADSSLQGQKEQQQLLSKLQRLGLLKPDARLDDVLSLTLNHILERRIQTVLHRKGMSRSAKQARQFITHRHVTVGGKEITSPSYLLSTQEEAQLSFKGNSVFTNADHPERVPIVREAKKERAPMERTGRGERRGERRGKQRGERRRGQTKFPQRGQMGRERVGGKAA